MNILTTEYSLSTQSLDIYLAGCKGPHCPGCHNPETWNFNQGIDFKDWFPKLKVKLESYPTLIKNIFVLGGEPLHHKIDDVLSLLQFLSSSSLPIWLFTRLPLSRVDKSLSSYLTYIKTGRYIRELATEDNIQFGIKLASSNQNIFTKGVDF